MRKLIFYGLVLLSFSVYSQEETIVQFSYDEFMARVKKHHPIVYQADIILKNGDAQMIKARGGFDPKLEGSMQQKYFNENQYYSLLNSGLKIPTWFGISAKAGYNQNEGVYLNSRDYLPKNGLWYAGLEIELGNGLFFDERRAELKKAKLFRQGTILEQKMILNDLTYDASMAYWDWMVKFKKKEVYKEFVSNAKFRLDAIRKKVTFGDRPAIDTVEARLQWQNRVVGLNQVLLDLENSKEKLQLYLWQKGFVPLEIANAMPVLISINEIKSKLSIDSVNKDSLLANHPYINFNELKFNQSEIDLRLKKEQLKPKVTLKYNALSESVGSDAFALYSMNNYTWGGGISYPILTRKERGAVQLSKLKLEQIQLDNTQAVAKLGYYVSISENKFNTSLVQLKLFEETVQFYEELYRAEVSVFNVGESSLFMINSREKSLVEAKLKLLDLFFKSIEAGYEFSYQLMVLS
jgi:outer membrane protein TolC